MAVAGEKNYIVGFKADEDFSALTDATVNVALKLDTDGKVTKAGAAAQNFVGFLQNAPKSGENAEIAGAGGESLAIAAGDIEEGQFCKINGDGHLVAMSSETANCAAFALQGAADNDVFRVLVMPPGFSITIA